MRSAFTEQNLVHRFNQEGNLNGPTWVTAVDAPKGSPVTAKEIRGVYFHNADSVAVNFEISVLKGGVRKTTERTISVGVGITVKALNLPIYLDSIDETLEVRTITAQTTSPPTFHISGDEFDNRIP